MKLLPLLFLAFVVTGLRGQDSSAVTFERRVLSDEYFADGIATGDINHDGHLDIVAGPFWYEGPDFRQRHRFYPADAVPTSAPASSSMFTFVYDFNGDGWPDILVMGRLLTTEIFWYENPRAQDLPWKKHFAAHRLYGESKLFSDVNGDGKPELIGHVDHRWGYLAPDWSHPDLPWKFTPITAPGTWPEYWHGTGLGDINGDGRVDLVLYDGWYEQPAQPGALWKHHPFKFGPGRGGAQMLIYDVDGDGLPDVVTAIDAHRWGLSWFRQLRDDRGNISFQEHRIMGDRSEEAKFGVAFSQPHALALADVNGDGLKDVIVSKRRWAHGEKGDVEPNAAPVVYWFELTRDAQHEARFVPHLVDDRSGGGVQIAAADLAGDGLSDILTASKLGTFLFIPHRQPSQLVRQLKAGKPQTLVIYGTSLSKGGAWVGQLKSALDQRYPGLVTLVNGARNGQNSRWGVENLDSHVLAAQPDVVFIEFSINDSVARFNLSLAESRKNLENMIQRIHAARPHCEIILQIMNPAVGKKPGDSAYRHDQPDYWQLYHDIGREQGLLVIDHSVAWNQLLTHGGDAEFLRYAHDGVHPNAEGWAKFVTPVTLSALGLAP